MPCDVPLCDPPRGQSITLLQIGWNILLALTGNGPWGAGIPVVPAAPTTLTLVEGTRTADFTVAAGATSFDLILSPDFTGTISGEAWDGSVDALFRQEAGSGYMLPAYDVEVTTGEVREYSLYPA